MCVLAFAWRAHPRWPLVVAGNRDELHARPTEPLARWHQPAHVLAGRDLQSGGSWLGVSEQGRFALVTNLRGYGGPDPERVSRGALVKDALSGERRDPDLPGTTLEEFNPFNLIVVDRGKAVFSSNRPEPVRSPLAPGVYGLSNGALDEPWPKTVRLKQRLLEWIAGAATQPELLLDDLRDESLPDPGTRAPLPSDVPQEPPLSPIFIGNPIYGTRCSTVVAVDDRGQGLIIERRYSPAGENAGETALAFSWPG
ncbi:MAG: NRDE family protein [Sphingomicrobium sp.]